MRFMGAFGRSTTSLRLLVAGVVCAGSSGCGAFVMDAVLRRASNEFACPSQRIEVIRRTDLTSGTYDLDACGSRARYTCIAQGDDYPPDVQCLREPDPSKWDPDPALLGTLPSAPGTSGDGLVASICYQGEQADCLRKEGGVWRWIHHQAPQSARGGLGTPGQ
jgi:hypothetical protein